MSGDALRLLSHIRWTAVNIEYIKDKMICSDMVVKDRTSFEFLSRVIAYKLNGIQFKGLRTHHRPSTELEACIVLIGKHPGNPGVTLDSCRVSLQNH